MSSTNVHLSDRSISRWIDARLKMSILCTHAATLQGPCEPILCCAATQDRDITSGFSLDSWNIETLAWALDRLALFSAWVHRNSSFHTSAVRCR